MERWNEINFILSEKIKPDTSETEFERNVIEALRILGWSEFKGDLKIRPSYNFGAANRLIPDILVEENDEMLFIIEIKQPGIPLKPRFVEQLISYMRYFRLEVGIIIGEKIQILYDDNKTLEPSRLVIDEIQFSRDNPKGKEFVKLFSKNSYDPNILFNKARQKRQEEKDQESVDKIKKMLTTGEYETQLKSLIHSDFKEIYSEAIVDKLINDIEIHIFDKTTPQISEEAYKKVSKPKTQIPFSDAQRTETKIGKYVRTSFSEILNKIDHTELANLQRADYCKEVFDIQFPFLLKVSSTDGAKQLRYWKDPVQILGEWYFMCSEWYEIPANNDRPYYEAWLKKILNK